MKKCPTCKKTFDDNMRFCQTDGTPLIEAAEPSDPYATMVASKDEIASAIPPQESSTAISPPKDDDFLEIPEADDPMKTSVVSEAEMRELAFENDLSGKSSPFGEDFSSPSELKSKESDFSSQMPMPPKFDEPNLNPPAFGDSPFSMPDSPKPSTGSEGSSPPKSDSPYFGSQSPPDESSTKAADNPFNSPIPSPFGEKMPPSYQTPLNSPFKDPEPPKNEPFSPFNEPSSPFGQSPFGDAEPKNQPLQQTEWTPASSPAGSFGEPAAMQTPSSSAPPAAGGQNKTLAIVSLVLGVLSIPCCGFIIIGIAAAITGFMAKSKADNNPNEYGGRSLALAGIIIGVITTLIGIVTNLLYILGILRIPNLS